MVEFFFDDGVPDFNGVCEGEVWAVGGFVCWEFVSGDGFGLYVALCDGFVDDFFESFHFGVDGGGGVFF